MLGQSHEHFGLDHPLTRDLAPGGQIDAAHFPLAPVAVVASPQQRHELFEKLIPNYAFNRSTHEKDLFSSSEVERRARQWRRIVLERKALAPA